MDEQAFWLIVNVELLVPLALLDDEGMTSDEFICGAHLCAGITGTSLASAQKRLVRLISELSTWQRDWFVVDYCRVSTLDIADVLQKLASVGVKEQELLQAPQLNGVWYHSALQYQMRKERL